MVEESKIEDGYETTNLWKIHPAHNKNHPAVFPLELAEKVIQYYSFKKDVILDPFAGTGTTGKAAVKNERRFVLFEQDEEYMKLIKDDVFNWLLKDAEKINWINTEVPTNKQPFLNF